MPVAYSAHLANGDPAAASKNYTPTHPDLFEVHFESGSYRSYLVALRDFPKGTVIAPFDSATPSDDIRFSTVQVSESEHIEINSDLFYCNHSCDPSVRFVVSGAPESRVAIAERDIRSGEAMTFFYPSSEWNMDQPFECHCGTSRCLGQIAGAAHLPVTALSEYYINAHILRLKEKQLRAAGKEESAREADLLVSKAKERETANAASVEGRA
ncbi:hypothetical protein CF326_g3985 [Tilletia indica]|uniref:Uncharacterized protein n=1 Tax=Tilletia indica TaxID=43049 RepID=A0A177TQT0_9BASI|nr:hypothetical protein CF326_g3985 [Tilletia indica]KAE8244840.1 hypothetical protein A4X13_0g6214 [Tilletia indica]